MQHPHRTDHPSRASRRPHRSLGGRRRHRLRRHRRPPERASAAAHPAPTRPRRRARPLRRQPGDVGAVDGELRRQRHRPRRVRRRGAASTPQQQPTGLGRRRTRRRHRGHGAVRRRRRVARSPSRQSPPATPRARPRSTGCGRCTTASSPSSTCSSPSPSWGWHERVSLPASPRHGSIEWRRPVAHCSSSAPHRARSPRPATPWPSSPCHWSASSCGWRSSSRRAAACCPRRR